MNPNDRVAAKAYIRDAEMKRKRQAVTMSATPENDLMLVDMSKVIAFASLIEGLSIMAEGVENDKPVPIVASVCEVRHFVHYMRQLDTEFRNAMGALDLKDKDVSSLKSQLAEAKRLAEENHAKYLIEMRKLALKAAKD